LVGSIIEGLTFNHLPKNVQIPGVSLRSAEFASKFTGLETLYEIASGDRLRAEDQVSDFSGGEIPQARGPEWNGRRSARAVGTDATRAAALGSLQAFDPDQ
jgi:hypothetical protein